MMGRASKSDAPSRKKGAGSIYRMEPAMFDKRRAGKQEKSITCFGDLFTCRERVAGNRDAEKSVSCNFWRIPSVRLRTLRIAHVAELVPTGPASEQMFTGCKKVNAPKAVQCLNRFDLRFQVHKNVGGPTILRQKIAFLLAGCWFYE